MAPFSAVSAPTFASHTHTSALFEMIYTIYKLLQRSKLNDSVILFLKKVYSGNNTIHKLLRFFWSTSGLSAVFLRFSYALSSEFYDMSRCLASYISVIVSCLPHHHHPAWAQDAHDDQQTDNAAADAPDHEHVGAGVTTARRGGKRSQILARYPYIFRIANFAEFSQNFRL